MLELFDEAHDKKTWDEFTCALKDHKLVFIRDLDVLGGFWTFYYWPAKSQYIRTYFYWEVRLGKGDRLLRSVAVVTEDEAKSIS